MRHLLLELGRGFAFVRSQVPLSVGAETFYLDLLFYYVRLHCYFVIELKVGKFRPEYAGQLNFYLSAVDGTLRTDRDDPTIGLLLCESKDGPVVEYSFKDIAKPIGVSSYTVTRELPEIVRDELPTIEDLTEVVKKLKCEIEALRSEQIEKLYGRYREDTGYRDRPAPGEEPAGGRGLSSPSSCSPQRDDLGELEAGLCQSAR